MGVLRGFERRLEGAVEGMFARAFKSGLQPIELAKAVQRYCEDQRHVTSKGIVAPNDFRLILHPDDLERMDAYGESLHRELGEVVRETCDAKGWELYGDPIFVLEGDDDILVGRFEVTGRIQAGGTGRRNPGSPSQPLFDESAPRADDTPIATATPQSPTPPAAATPPASTPTAAMSAVGSGAAATRTGSQVPALHLEVLDTGDGLVVRAGRHTIGRSDDCDLTIDSTTVSRKHAVVVQRGDTWWVFDLGSTNGTQVNGHRASELPIRPGDRLRIGTVELLVREA